jgi:hypothetical protein
MNELIQFGPIFFFIGISFLLLAKLIADDEALPAIFFMFIGIIFLVAGVVLVIAEFQAIAR